MLMRLGKRSLRDRGSRRGGGRTARSALPRSDATTQGLRARRRRVRGGLARCTEGGAYPGRLTAGQAGRHATCRQRRTASAFERCHKNCSRARPLRRSAPSASTLLTLGKIRRHFCDPHPSTQPRSIQTGAGSGWGSEGSAGDGGRRGLRRGSSGGGLLGSVGSRGCGWSGGGGAPGSTDGLGSGPGAGSPGNGSPGNGSGGSSVGGTISFNGIRASPHGFSSGALLRVEVLRPCCGWMSWTSPKASTPQGTSDNCRTRHPATTPGATPSKRHAGSPMAQTAMSVSVSATMESRLRLPGSA